MGGSSSSVGYQHSASASTYGPSNGSNAYQSFPNPGSAPASTPSTAGFPFPAQYAASASARPQPEKRPSFGVGYVTAPPSTVASPVHSRSGSPTIGGQQQTFSSMMSEQYTQQPHQQQQQQPQQSHHHLAHSLRVAFGMTPIHTTTTAQGHRGYHNYSSPPTATTSTSAPNSYPQTPVNDSPPQNYSNSATSTRSSPRWFGAGNLAASQQYQQMYNAGQIHGQQQVAASQQHQQVQVGGAGRNDSPPLQLPPLVMPDKQRAFTIPAAPVSVRSVGGSPMIRGF
ncbi:hypothetical protein FRB90_005947 [Tulasnella sp. 427]|nr:hypothetical protein FRB90_005947 [Tulasnella sp. 427]